MANDTGQFLPAAEQGVLVPGDEGWETAVLVKVNNGKVSGMVEKRPQSIEVLGED